MKLTEQQRRIWQKLYRAGWRVNKDYITGWWISGPDGGEVSADGFATRTQAQVEAVALSKKCGDKIKNKKGVW